MLVNVSEHAPSAILSLSRWVLASETKVSFNLSVLLSLVLSKKSTNFRTTRFSFLLLEKKEEKGVKSLFRWKQVWFGASTNRVGKQLAIQLICSPFWSRFRAWLIDQHLSSCDPSVRRRTFCWTFHGSTRLRCTCTAQRCKPRRQKTLNMCPQMLIAPVGYIKRAAILDHCACGKASIALWTAHKSCDSFLLSVEGPQKLRQFLAVSGRPTKAATVCCCQWLAA